MDAPERDEAVDPLFLEGAAAPEEPPVDPVLQEFWETVKRVPRYVRLAAHLARDTNVPWSAKAMLAAGGAYAVSPVDLIPGIIPVLGQLDDLAVLLVAIRVAISACPDEIAQVQLERAGLTRDDLDKDLATVKETAIWLGRKGVSYTGRFMRRTAQLSGTAAHWSRERLQEMRARR